MFKVKRNTFLTILSVSTFLLTGCSAFAPSTQQFNVNTNASDAQIFINGFYVGSGSVKTIVPRDHPLYVTAQKNGYHPISMYVGTRLSKSGTLDSLGAIFILPIIGLAFPGSQELAMETVSLMFPIIQKNALAVNVPNSNGSYTVVNLIQRGNGYIGPQGEYYESYPTVDQLKVLYGK